MSVVDDLPTIDGMHLQLIEQGYKLRESSRAGSRYYGRFQSPDVRVSDHEPNRKTYDWIKSRGVHDIRVRSIDGESPDVDDGGMELSYHARPEISRSMIATFRQSPRLYEARYVRMTLGDSEPTDAMMIGTLTHQQLLEPNIASRIRIVPKEILAKNGARSTTAYKEWESEVLRFGGIPMLQSDYETAMRAVEAVRKEIGQMIDNPQGMREHEIYWTHERTGLELRAKLDLLVPTPFGWHIPDFKTTADLDRFKWQVNDGLWLQPAHYTAGVKAVYGHDADFWFFVVEKTGTFRARAIGLDEERSALAVRRWEATLDDLNRRYETDDWSESGEGEITRIGEGLKF